MASNHKKQKKKLAELESMVSNLERNYDEFKRGLLVDFEKMLTTVFTMEDELIDKNESGDLSVTAQVLLEETATRALTIVAQCQQEHKNVHSAVSKIGKAVERHFAKELGDLFSKEKDLESDKYKQSTSALLHDMLLSDGNVDIAKTLRKEAGLEGVEEHECAEMCKTILEDLLKHDTTSALKYVEEKAPTELKLKYDLRKQRILQLIVDGKESEAFLLATDLEYLGDETQTATIFGAMFLGPAVEENPRYKHMFGESVWESLALRLAEVMAPSTAGLVDIISSGIPTMKKLMGLKKTFGVSNLQIDDELPVEVEITRPVHSTFTCPILKEQSSEKNPPMKLLCGHVISKEAMNRLSTARLSGRTQTLRSTRLKCPYCPKEQNFDHAKQVIFSSKED